MAIIGEFRGNPFYLHRVQTNGAVGYCVALSQFDGLVCWFNLQERHGNAAGP